MIKSNLELMWLCVHRQTGQKKALRESEAFDLDKRLWKIEPFVNPLTPRKKSPLAEVLCEVYERPGLIRKSDRPVLIYKDINSLHDLERTYI